MSPITHVIYSLELYIKSWMMLEWNYYGVAKTPTTIRALSLQNLRWIHEDSNINTVFTGD